MTPRYVIVRLLKIRIKPSLKQQKKNTDMRQQFRWGLSFLFFFIIINGKSINNFFTVLALNSKKKQNKTTKRILSM